MGFLALIRILPQRNGLKGWNTAQQKLMYGLAVKSNNSGILFYVLMSKVLIWGAAKLEDVQYAKYVKRRDTGFAPFETCQYQAKKILYTLLDPNPQTRPEIAEILKDPWVAGIKRPAALNSHSRQMSEPLPRKKSAPHLIHSPVMMSSLAEGASFLDLAEFESPQCENINN